MKGELPLCLILPAMKEASGWYVFKGMDRIDSPALVVFPDRVKQNIQAAIQLAGDVNRLRPHAKTHKSPELTRLLLQAGIHQFKCSTIAEAEMLAMEGVQDILLAYQLVGPKTDRFLELRQAYPNTNFSSLVDNSESALELLAKAAAFRLPISVYLDLDVGMHRTGMEPDAAAIELFLNLNQREGITVKGLHAYDGHIADPDPVLRKKQVEAAFAPVWNMKAVLQDKGCLDIEIIAGGMPSFPMLASFPDLICSPGTFVFFDQSYSLKLADTPFVPAAVVLSRVISKPGTNRITTDLGHKSIASENGLDKRVHWLNVSGLKPLGHSEEHFFFETDAANSIQVGDLLVGLPWHICPTVALYEKAYTVEDGTISGEWTILARNRKLSI
jgi:D-serine deaminase-like pyridoxal phosphate-dependent protein